MALSALVRRLPDVTVVEAEDGQAAWELLNDGLRPAVCCTDLQMPRMGGLGLMRRVRDHPLLTYLPFIFVTATADHESVDAAIVHRAAGFIVKPFGALSTRSMMERVIRECVAGRAEPPFLTRQRLQQSASALRQMLELLHQDVQDVARQVAGGAGEPVMAACVSRLRGGCQTLGLWRAVQVCDAAWPLPVAGLAWGAALNEMACEIRWQLQALRQES